MKSYFLLLFCLAMFSHTVSSQQQLEGIGLIITPGYLNARSSGSTFSKISPDGITSFHDDYKLIGLEGFYRYRRNVLGAEWNFCWQKRYQAEDTYAEPYITSLRIKYGYITNKNSKMLFYPTVAAGTTKMLLTTYTKEGSRVINLNDRYLLLPSFAMALNCDRLISKFDYSERYYLGWITGVRAGYEFSIQSNRWKINQGKNLHSPAYAPRGFYISIAFGAGDFDFAN